MFELWRWWLWFVPGFIFEMGHRFADITKQQISHIRAEPFTYHDTQHRHIFCILMHDIGWDLLAELSEFVGDIELAVRIDVVS